MNLTCIARRSKRIYKDFICSIFCLLGGCILWCEVNTQSVLASGENTDVYSKITHPHLKKLPLRHFEKSYQQYNASFSIENSLLLNTTVSVFSEHGLKVDHEIPYKNNSMIPLVANEAVRTQEPPAKGYNFWSGKTQAGEDLYAYENWFFGMSKGTILESGGLDGISFSTSWFFEHSCGWDAYHVEADVNNYDSLLKNRPHSLNVAAALCNDPKELHYLSGYGPVSGIFEFMPEAYLKEFHSEYYNNPSKVERLDKIVCVPPRLLFAGLSLRRIDIWVLDVEGAELGVLHGVDFDAIDIKTIIMECLDGDPNNGEKVAFLKTKGYSCEMHEHDCMCQHKSFVPSKGRVFDGYAVIGDTGKQIFLLRDDVLLPFANYDVYTAYIEKQTYGPTIKVPDAYLSKIPKGETFWG